MNFKSTYMRNNIGCKIVVYSLLAGYFLACVGDAATDEKAPFDRAKAGDGGLGMPTPYDKFLVLDQVLNRTKVDWAELSRALGKPLDTDAFKDVEVGIPLALGVRIADGVMTVKAKDAELLNKCASDIEKLAKKLGVTDAEMSRARAVRSAANRGDWLKVFMELGFFQQDIMKKLTDEKNAAKGTLVVIGGWLQGARYTAAVVEQNYSPDISNILREPLLVRNLVEKSARLPEGVKSAAKVVKVTESLSALAGLLDVPTDGSITKENVHKISVITTEVVTAASRATN
jgi:hypothetical protein